MKTLSRAERRQQEREKNKRPPDAIQIWREEVKKSRNGVEYKEKVPYIVTINPNGGQHPLPEKGVHKASE